MASAVHAQNRATARNVQVPPHPRKSASVGSSSFGPRTSKRTSINNGKPHPHKATVNVGIERMKGNVGAELAATSRSFRPDGGGQSHAGASP